MDWYPFQWYPYLSIGMHSRWIGLDWYPMQWIQLHTIGYRSTAGRRPGQNAKGRGWFSLQSGQSHTITGGERHAEMRYLRRLNWSRPSASPTPSTSRRCTASATAATTSSGRTWPPASSPRSSPAPGRWRPCPEARPRSSMIGPASAAPVCAATRRSLASP